MRLTIALAAMTAAFSGAQCIDGKWDPSYIWTRDCTPGNAYDGQFGTTTATHSVTGEVKIKAADKTHTLSWKLQYFKGNLSGSLSRDKLPLIVGLHPWSDNSPISHLLNIESDLLLYEGAWEDILILTVALENGNNMNTWWDGSKLNGVPTTWAMDGIVELIKTRKGDAAALLAGAGAGALASKSVDPNRVYLVGTSMGGSGTYHIGVRHPELFAAVHANAGFADYDGPCGTTAFCTSFTNDFVGTEAENLQMKGIDGKDYPARKYANMSWFAGTHNGASWTASVGKGARYEPPYMAMTHGKGDNVVNIASADRLLAVLRDRKFGYSFFRHEGGHSNENFMRLHWLLGFRLDQSYLAFTNNSTDNTFGAQKYNFLDKVGWMPSSIVDETNRYEVKLTGPGTVDITPRRLQRFVVPPTKGFHFWLDTETGPGTAVTSDAGGVLTIPKVAVAATTTLIIKPDIGSAVRESPGARTSGIPGQGRLRNAEGQVWFSARDGDGARNGLGRAMPR